MSYDDFVRNREYFGGDGREYKVHQHRRTGGTVKNKPQQGRNKPTGEKSVQKSAPSQAKKSSSSAKKKLSAEKQNLRKETEIKSVPRK